MQHRYAGQKERFPDGSGVEKERRRQQKGIWVTRGR